MESGIPPMGYGQSYYTLRSIFMDRVPPPFIHLHIRCYDVAKSVPIGDLQTSETESYSNLKGDVNTDIPEHERQKFDLWLRDRWSEKDEMIDNYHSRGCLVPYSINDVTIPIKLRKLYDFLGAFCFFTPWLLIILVKYGIRYLN